MSDVKFGELQALVGQRDAVHVAVISVEAGEILKPGDQVVHAYGNVVERKRRPSQKVLGIVDPFLTCDAIAVGNRFWLLLNPGTVLKLRHAWETEEFPAEDVEAEDDVCRGCW